ncbi:MAG: hypothetical protein M4579_007228, partial [Chaenotheca gracillima]
MGQRQSSDEDGGSGGQPRQRENRKMKTCYYELLGVSRQATEDEIKKAYRKKALELHPDRNYGNVEYATNLFAEIQGANEVLSDPQERAWYDSHRDAILRDEDEGTGEHFEHDVRVTTAEDVMKLFTKINGRMDFTDSPTGFFGVLRDTFDKLAHEEDLACDWEGIDPLDYPSFGRSDDSYEDVAKPFYAAWSGFATKKTFAWKDIYRYSEAPDRRVRRMMEKENKRLRDDGIREFNDSIRSLVAFVKKRDPRYAMNAKSDAERQKTLREAAAAQAARQRAANQAKYEQHVVPEWTKSPEDEPEDVTEEESEEEQIECVACRKTFKSENQYEAHEKSKKHVKAIQKLRRAMQKQNKSLDLDNVSSSGMATPDSIEAEDMADGQTTRESDPDAVSPGLVSESAEQEDYVQAAAPRPDEDAPDAEQIDKTPEDSGSEISNDEYAPRSIVEDRISDLQPEEKPSTAEDVESLSAGVATAALNDEDSVATTPSGPKLGKAKEKRAKKAAA